MPPSNRLNPRAPDGPRRPARGNRPEGRPEGRRVRPFGNGDLKLILLACIADSPSHGYELIKSIEERLGGGYSPSPGIVYPTLTLLEELGLLAASADGAKKLYTITDAGRQHLADNHDTVAKLDARMTDFGARTDGGRLDPVTRALENLKLALRMRTARGQLTDDQIAAIRTVLDQSATQIEQI
jgi:DNA-binding PadR family transcriptional regulator